MAEEKGKRFTYIYIYSFKQTGNVKVGVGSGWTSTAMCKVGRFFQSSQ